MKADSNRHKSLITRIARRLDTSRSKRWYEERSSRRHWRGGKLRKRYRLVDEHLKIEISDHFSYRLSEVD